MATDGSIRGSTGFRIFTGATAGIAVLVLVLTQAVGGGDPTDLGQRSEEIRLEPISYTPPDPFTEPLAPDDPPPADALTVDEDAATTTRVDAPITVSRLLPVQPASPGSVRSATTDTVGLFGGSLRYSRCARERLVGFLESSPAKARAWVRAFNEDPTFSWSGGRRLEPFQIRDYVFELTPVILRSDTWVTNHGYAGGRATPIQSVLQAGTAVLVDRYGIPRVKCYCGNPLLPPGRFRPRYTGPRWDGFDPGRVLVLTPPTTIIDRFTLYDIRTGSLFQRAAGTEGGGDVPSGPTPGPSPTGDLAVPPDLDLGAGDVQVTLVWDSGDDLDLHVVDPDGSEIAFSSPRAPSGGRLDRDDTAGCGSTDTKVENVFWPEGTAPTGGYEAFVVNFSGCGGSAAFELTVRVGGTTVYSDTGSLSGGEQTSPVSFTA